MFVHKGSLIVSFILWLALLTSPHNVNAEMAHSLRIEKEQCQLLQREIEANLNDLELDDSYKGLMKALWRQEHAQNLLLIYNAGGCDPMAIQVKSINK